MIRDASALIRQLKGSLVAALICVGYHVEGADAQVVVSCDFADILDQTAHPHSLNTRSFANGNVTVAVIDDGRDDVAQALSVIVISPPLDAMGEPQCRRVSATESNGYAALILDSALAQYDPAVGLTVTLPALVLETPESIGDKVDLSVTINQATGMITPMQQGDTE